MTYNDYSKEQLALTIQWARGTLGNMLGILEYFRQEGELDYANIPLALSDGTTLSLKAYLDEVSRMIGLEPRLVGKSDSGVKGSPDILEKFFAKDAKPN